jgi:hypothetical protein
MLTRFVTFMSMATLAVAVLWRFSPDYRMLVCVVVSVGGITLAIRALSAGKLLWGLVFVGVLGVFTPFRSTQFSHALVSALDMATLALFAFSPLLLKKSRIVPIAPDGSIDTARRFTNEPE